MSMPSCTDVISFEVSYSFTAEGLGQMPLVSINQVSEVPDR